MSHVTVSSKVSALRLPLDVSPLIKCYRKTTHSSIRKLIERIWQRLLRLSLIGMALKMFRRFLIASNSSVFSTRLDPELLGELMTSKSQKERRSEERRVG